jgi:hypothetical protein
MYLLVLLALVACEKKKEAPKTGAGTGTGTAVVVAVPSGTVEVFVDEQSVAKIAPADVAKWQRLDALVPEEARRLGTWEKLVFTSPPAVSSQLEKPAQNHPDKVPVIFPAKDGKPAFGMFDPVALANKGEPAFRADNLKEIRLTISKTERGGMHQGSTGEAIDPTKIVLKIKTPDGEKQITGPEILKLPREPQPGSEDTQGWRVTQFLDAAGVTKYESITLADAGGTTVPLTKKELDPKTSNPFVKLNKSGQLRFRMFTKKGEGWEQGADLRALTSITVK